ncbi:phage/plasmid replication protein, II/X family, partial [Vibrio breoganii]
ELKGSPAKLLQGHNVYGSTSLSTGSVEMLMILMHNYPDFYEMLNIQDTLLDAVDCTYSAKLANEFQCKQVIQLLKNISNGHVRSSVQNEYESTTYFNRNSRHVDRKVYLKYPEFKNQLHFYKKMTKKGDSRYTRLIDVMSDPQLINYSRNLIRFESRAHRRYLDKFEVPHKLFDAIKFQYSYEENGSSLIKDIWMKSWDKVFETFKGEKMNFNNDEEIRDKLRSVHFTYTPKGNISYSKADRLFIFFKLILNEGYDTAKLLVPKATFNRNVKALVDSGLSKAQLQNLKSHESNVVPLVNIIDVNFENQRPSDFVEPIGELTKLYNFPVEELRVAS